MAELIDRSGYFAGPGMLGGEVPSGASRPVAGEGADASGAAAGADGTGSGAVAPEPSQAVFYELTRKFVETEDEVPDDAKDVLYYTLSVGHHTGVMDCFEPKLACPLPVFRAIVEGIPESDARFKLEGLERFGEIQIDKESAPLVLDAVKLLMSDLGFRGSAKAGIDFLDPDFGMHAQELAFLMRFKDLLERICSVTAVYVTGRLQ